MTLPFIPNPIKNEHPKFYLAKLAMANGYPFMENMLHANTQKLPVHQAQQFNAFKAIINELTGIEYHITYSDQDIYEHNRYFPSLLSPHAKVCPKCCKEGHSPLEHSFLFANHCDKHNIQLVDNCSVCNQTLEWDNILTEGKCNYCGSHLPELLIEQSPIQAYVKQHGLKQSLPFIDDICLMASHLVRPLDNHPESITKKRIIDSGSLFDKAYTLLTNAKARNTWLQYLQESRLKTLYFLGGNAINAPFFSVVNLLKLEQWSVPFKSFNSDTGDTLTIEFTEYFAEDFSIQSLWKTKSKDLNEQNLLARYKCNAQLMALILGCTEKTVYALSKCGLFKSLNTKGYSVSTYFDLREVCSSIPESFNLTGFQSDNLVDFAEVQRILPHFNLDETYFIKALITNRVPILLQYSTAPIFKRIQITPFTLFRILTKNVLGFSNENIEHSKAKVTYCLSELDIRALLQHNKIEIEKWKQVATYYKTKNFESMEKSHLNLARYCFFRGLNFKAISERLREKGILPVFGKSYFSNRMYVLHFIKTGKVIMLPPNKTASATTTTKSIQAFLNNMPILNNKKR